MLSSDLKKIKLKRTTKNGYEISIIDALEDPNDFIPESIKKLAHIAKITTRIISSRFIFPKPKNVFIELFCQKMNGNIVIVVSNEVINKKANGENSWRIFWSIT